MPSWTKAQWDAFGRHVLTAAGTVVALLVALNLTTQAQGGELLSHITNLVNALIGLAAVVGPAYAAWRAARSASPEKQAEATVANLKASIPLNGEKDKLVAAVANQPDVAQVIMKDPENAAEIPSPKVV